MAVGEEVSMEVEPAEGTDKVPASQPIVTNVMQVIKTAQQQHGLRHGDYQRYRQYCFRRLRRLYKSVKLLHGRGKYQRKTIEPHMVTDERMLHIPLFNAERAWSYAMELKSVSGGPNPRQRFHLIRRLTKAAKWADALALLCNARADSRTMLEAEAYSSWMWGNVLFEREDDWNAALSKFLRARTVYEQLSRVGGVEAQVLCRQRLEELEPNIRYCNYKLGGAAKSEDLSELMAQEGPAMDLLQSKLEAVMEEARVQQAAFMTDLAWQGRKLPLRNEKTRLAILKGQDLAKDLEGTATSPLSTERKLGLYDRMFVSLQDAKKTIRDDLAAAGGASAPADIADEYRALDSAVSGMLLQRTMERNLLLVEQARLKLERQQIGAPLEKGEKPVRPEDLVRLYDTLIQNVSDFLDIVGSGRDKSAEGVELVKANEARRTGYQAARCFCVAQAHATAGRYAEAYVLYSRSAEHAESALQGLQSCRSKDQARVAEVAELLARARAQRSLVHAQGCAEAARAQEHLQQSVQDLKLQGEGPKATGEGKYLLDFADEYVSALGSATTKEAPRIAEVPPPFQAVPCRPIVLDTALNMIEFPSLDQRVKKEVKKGGLFGFWRR